jgi:hypothetical protein
MKLKDARDNYYFYSGKTSDIIRQLALAGIAIVWLYKVDRGGAMKIPVELRDPLLLIVIGLALDLLQYATATGVWGVYQRQKEEKGTAEDQDFKAPSAINLPTIFLFISKVVCVAFAYAFLLRHIYRTMF